MSLTVSASGQIPLALALKERPGFDLYVTGDNTEAIHRIQHLVRGSLYVWAQTGSGITHLLQAACMQASELGKQVAYIPLKEHHTLNPQLLENLDVMDMVCIDDIDLIAGRMHWEQPILHLYNRMRDKGSALLIGAHASPQSLEFQLADLKSRMGWDLVYHLKPLVDKDKISVLQKRAAARAFELPDEVADYLVKRVPRDLSSLIGLLDELEKATLAEQRKLTIPFVKLVIKD